MVPSVPPGMRYTRKEAIAETRDVSPGRLACCGREPDCLKGRRLIRRACAPHGSSRRPSGDQRRLAETHAGPSAETPSEFGGQPRPGLGQLRA